SIQAQSPAPDDAANDTTVLVESSLSGLNPDVAAATTPSGSPLPDAPLPSDKSLESSSHANLSSVSPVLPTQTLPPFGKFDMKSAFWQSFGVNFFFQVWRVAFDPGLRWNLVHKPFYHDWFASYPKYNMQRWGDG